MDKIMPYLEELAKQLGVAVEHVWGILVKQSIVNGISDLINGGIYLVLFGLSIFFTPKIYKFFDSKYQDKKQDRIKNGTGHNGSYITSSEYEDFLNGLRFAIIGILIITIFILLFGIQNNICLGIKQLYNPEYYALQDILKVIGK